jgi:hypothetical protein
MALHRLKAVGRGLSLKGKKILINKKAPKRKKEGKKQRIITD